MPMITGVKIRLKDTQGSIVANADVTIGKVIKVYNFTVVKKNDGTGYFVGYPRIKAKFGDKYLYNAYREDTAEGKEFDKELQKVVVNAYNKAKTTSDGDEDCPF